MELGDRRESGPAGLERNPVGRRTADRRRAANDHVADGGGDLGRGLAGDVFEALRQEALVDQLEAIAGPAQRLDRARHQITRSLPPSIGSCAPVVLANSGPHISAASSATSPLVTSVRRTLLVLYCSTVMP